MLNNLLALLAVLSLAPAPEVAIHPIEMYGLSVPLEPQLVQVSEAKVKLPPIKKDVRDLGVVHSGKSAFVADVESAGVLYANNPHDVHSIASLTKLMTALVVLDSNLDMEEDIVLAREDFDVESRSTLRIGDAIPRKDALRALMIGSINELGNAFARSSGMSRGEFIEKMNQKAQELNLRSLKFVDPTGLEEANRGNAADVAALLTTAIRNQSIRDAMQENFIILTTKVGRQYTIDTTNLLMFSYLNQAPYRIIGAKTGSLPTTGYNLAQVTQNGDGNEVVTVLLGSNNHYERYDGVKALTAWAFDAYTWR
jgi:serine-type D-Ala-D-Ala endopeptidase (penicillin-binding protein 7)